MFQWIYLRYSLNVFDSIFDTIRYNTLKNEYTCKKFNVFDSIRSIQAGIESYNWNKYASTLQCWVPKGRCKFISFSTLLLGKILTLLYFYKYLHFLQKKSKRVTRSRESYGFCTRKLSNLYCLLGSRLDNYMIHQEYSRVFTKLRLCLGNHVIHEEYSQKPADIIRRQVTKRTCK